jgi:hypothetical protein
VETALLKQRRQTLIFWLQIEVYQSDRCETCSDIQGRPWLLITVVQKFKVQSVGKCGVVERAVYVGQHGVMFAYRRMLQLTISHYFGT